MTTPGRAELAAALRSLLTESGLEQQDVAGRIGVSKPTMSRYLRGKSVPGIKMVRAIISATGQEGTDAAQDALRLGEEVPSGNAGRVVLLPPGTTTSQRRWREEVLKSSRVEEYAMTAPCGALQTERYARAIFTAGGQAPADLERNLKHRMAGQAEILDSPDRSATLLMPEGVFSWQVESPDLVIEQLEHIAQLAARDTGGRVRIGLIRRVTPVGLFPMGNMTIYDGRVVVTGTDFGTAYIDSRPTVEWYQRRFAALCELATWDSSAAVEFQRLAEEYRRLLSIGL